MKATRLLFRGQRRHRAGHPAEALEALDRAAEAAPGSPHVALHRALALADCGRLDEALAALAEAASRWPDNPVFPLFRGGLLAENDRLAEAEAALEAARRLSPSNRLALAYEGLVAMRRGSVGPALRRLAAVGLTDSPRALAALLTEIEAELFRRFGTDTDGQPPGRGEAPAPDEGLRKGNPARLVAAGAAQLEKGNPAAARRLLAAAAELNPSLPDVFAHLGFALFDLGDYEGALDTLSRVGDWSAMLAAVHLHRGAALYKLGRLPEALAELEAARQADELADYTTYIEFYLGRTLVALGRRAEARARFRAFIDLEADVAMARLRQARELLGLAVPESAPKGYDVLHESRATLVVKTGLADAIREGRPAADGAPERAGRAPMGRIELPDGVGLVRHCRRGGLLAPVLGDLYLDGNRFLRELAVADALRRSGVPTPEVLAGIRREVLPGLYRAEIVTREVAGSQDLAAALRERPGSKGDLLAAAARLLRQAHDAGLRHPDLNARNILIAPDGSAMILDLDRADLADELSLRDREGSIARLYRSLHKLGLAPEPVSDGDWAAFYETYAGDDEPLRARAEAVMSRCRREARRHGLWWRLVGKRP